MRNIFLHPGNNLPFIEARTPNLEDNAYKAFRDAVYLDSKENENMSPSLKEFLRWHLKLCPKDKHDHR